MREALGLPDRVGPGDRDRALSDRVDPTIRARQRCHDKLAPQQRAGIAHRRHRDVDAGTPVHERWKLGGDEHGGHVAGTQADVAHVDAQTIKHRLDRLLGERRVAQGVAAALETDYQTIADELVIANAFELRDVLDSYGGLGRPGRQHQRDDDEELAHQPGPTWTLPSAATVPPMVMPLSMLRTVTKSPTPPAWSAEA